MECLGIGKEYKALGRLQCVVCRVTEMKVHSCTRGWKLVVRETGNMLFELESTEDVSTLLSGVPVLAIRRLGPRQLGQIQNLAKFKTTQRHNSALHRQESFGRGKAELRDADPALRACLEKG